MDDRKTPHFRAVFETEGLKTVPGAKFPICFRAGWVDPRKEKRSQSRVACTHKSTLALFLRAPLADMFWLGFENKSRFLQVFDMGAVLSPSHDLGFIIHASDGGIGQSSSLGWTIG